MDSRRIGPYRLEHKLGAGGMGIVYAAWDERLERRVALKQIRPEMAGEPLRRERFLREARAVAQLDHPAIVRIHDLLEMPEGDWLVLQYVEGPTLAQRLSRGPLPPEQVIKLASEILGALAAAHARGLLHRDLKPENVVIAPSGQAMVLDFGLAKLYAPEANVAADGNAPGTAGVVGTFRVMSPEQANGLPLDPRSDLFSLGVLLYEAATGVSPFEAETPVETLTRVCTHLQRPVRAWVPTVPEPLSALIDALLEKDADRRPRSATEALARIEGGTVEVDRLHPGASRDTEVEAFSSGHRAQRSSPPSARGIAAERTPSIAPYRTLRPRHFLLPVAALALLAAIGFFVAQRLRSRRPLPEPLYVAVARPEVGLGAGREDVALTVSALQESTLRSLTTLQGVAALSPGATESAEPAPTVQRLARLLAAKEVLTATIECRPRLCQAVLRRQRGSDGSLISSTPPFEVPLDDPHLLDTAVSAYLKPLFPGFQPRPGESALQVRGEDYQRYLRVERRWQENRPADLDPLTAELERIRAASPLFLDAYLLGARIAGYRFYQTRDPRELEQALSLIREARRLAPFDPQPLNAWFSVALDAGRVTEAEEALRALEQRSPGDVRTVQRRAMLSEQRGDRQGALALLRDATARHPSASFLMGLANLEMRVGKIPAARATLNDLLRRLPGHEGGEKLLAQLELEAGNPDRAAELYAGLARRSPSFAHLSNLGLSELLLGRYGEAAASLRRAFLLAPQSYAAALNLGDVEYLLGRRTEAETLYRRVLELVARDPAPDHWQLLAAQAQALAHLGRKTESVATLQRAIVAAPDNPEVAYCAALVYSSVGDVTSALANAERALSHGYNRRWFSLPWFEPLREQADFQRLLAPPARASSDLGSAAR